jgi:hypothetical protein
VSILISLFALFIASPQISLSAEQVVFEASTHCTQIGGDYILCSSPSSIIDLDAYLRTGNKYVDSSEKVAKISVDFKCPVAEIRATIKNNQNDSREIISDGDAEIFIPYIDGSISTTMMNFQQLFTLNAQCYLKIKSASIKSKIDSSTVSGWNDRLGDLTANKSDVEKSIEGWEAAINHFAVLRMMDTLAKKFYEDLTSEESIEIRKHASGSATTILKLLTNAEDGVYTPEEKQTLVKTVSALLLMEDESEWVNTDGSIKKIEDFFSNEDREKLEALGEEALENDEQMRMYETNLTEALGRKGEITADIAELEGAISLGSN